MTRHRQRGDRPGRGTRVPVVAITALACSLAGCSGTVGFSNVSGSGASTDRAASTDRGASTTGRSGTMGDGRDIPAIPQIVVPDVTTLTRNAERINTAFGTLADPGQGVTVTGARCDGSGRITNGSGLTIVDGDGAGRVDGPRGPAGRTPATCT